MGRVGLLAINSPVEVDHAACFDYSDGYHNRSHYWYRDPSNILTGLAGVCYELGSGLAS
jgi:hypothetical protein